MPVIDIRLRVRAPIAACFDAARDIDLHQRSMAHTGERAVAGVTSGLIGLGEEVTWEAKHLGVRQRLTSRIAIFERPHRFRDVQVRGAFARFEHDHYFEELGPELTEMRDVFAYGSPFGLLGRLVDAVFLENYMRGLLRQRALAIRDALETPTR